MTEEQKNELTVWEPSPFDGEDLLPVSLGSKPMDTTGRENIEAGDLILPSLSLLQGSSELVKQGIEGARAGIFWLSGAEEPFKSPLRVLACAHTKQRSLRVQKDRSEHAGLEDCMSRDAIDGDRYGACDTCPHKEWDNTNNRPPACSEAHLFTVLTPMGPAVMYFRRTSLKAARKLLTAWNMSPDPLWAHPLIVSVSQRQDMVDGKQSTTHVMETKWAQRETVPPHVQQAARAIYEQVTAAHDQGRFAGASDRDDD